MLTDWTFLNGFFIFSISLSFAVNSGRLAWVRHSSRKSSATHSYQRVQYFPVSKRWYGCQCLGFLTSAQMLMHAIAHGGCSGTVRVCTGSWLWEKIPLLRRGLEPASVLRLAFQSDPLPTEHTPSTAFRHLPPNSARFSYATEAVFFISAQLSSDAVSALRKVWVLVRLWKQPSAQTRT